MLALKTLQTEKSVERFLDNLPDDRMRGDCYTIIKMMRKITGLPPKMWGPAIIGFGQYHYKYESGHEGDICLTGFSPRKANLSLYVLARFPGQEDLLARLGKHKAGKGCLYVKQLADIDLGILETLIDKSFNFMKKKHTGK
jgi:Domain of unknown function (DU1801)